MAQTLVTPHVGFSGLPKEFVAEVTGFDNPSHEWRRVWSEFFGTFLLVMVAAGGGMMAEAFPGQISRSAAVVAPGLMVMAMIMFMGKVSGAHFNPAVSLGFALRGDFPWRRVPAYLIAQLAGALAAAALIQSIVHVSATYGATYPAHSVTGWAAFVMEALLTLGLLSVILGTASGAQNIGIIGALAVGAYIALAGLWASPLSGASMNPFRSLGPDIIGNDYRAIWVYLAGPIVGMLIAVGAAFVLRGSGGGVAGSLAAQGSLDPEISSPEKP